MSSEGLSSSGTCCQYLEWDSELFGQRIARVVENRLDAESRCRVLKWCRELSIDCLYFLAEEADVVSRKVAEDSGFRLVDVRVTLVRTVEQQAIQQGTPSRYIRPVAKRDIPALKSITSASHRDSRFYCDERFSREKCDMLYATWIENSCNGFADAVLVADIGGTPKGYITCHLREDGWGDIGLVAVHSEAQGSGIGSDLITASVDWFYKNAAQRLRVVTQGRNAPARRLYERREFVTRSVQCWYHRWFSRVWSPE